jgi:hypothetical protein
MTTHDATKRYGLGSRPSAARFTSAQAAKDAGVWFCQRITGFAPDAIVSGRGRNWVCRILFPDSQDGPKIYLREIAPPRAKLRTTNATGRIPGEV